MTSKYRRTELNTFENPDYVCVKVGHKTLILLTKSSVSKFRL